MSQKIDCVSFAIGVRPVSLNKDDNFGKLLKKAAKDFKLPQSLVGIFPLQSSSIKLPIPQWEPAVLKWKKSDNVLQKSNGIGYFVYDEGSISAQEKALLEKLEKKAEILAKVEAARAAEAKKNAKLGIKPVVEVKPAPEVQKPAVPQQPIAKQKSNDAQKAKKNSSQDRQVSRQKSQEKAKKSEGFTIEEPVFPSVTRQKSEESAKAKKNASFSKEESQQQQQQQVSRQRSQERAKRNSSFGKDEKPAVQRQKSQESNKSKRTNSAGIQVPQSVGNPAELDAFLGRLQARQDELEKRFERFFESLQSKLDGLQSKQDAFLGDLQANQSEQQRKLERFLQSA